MEGRPLIDPVCTTKIIKQGYVKCVCTVLIMKLIFFILFLMIKNNREHAQRDKLKLKSLNTLFYGDSLGFIYYLENMYYILEITSLDSCFSYIPI